MASPIARSLRCACGRVTRNKLTSASDVALALTGVHNDVTLQAEMEQVGLGEQVTERPTRPPSGAEDEVELHMPVAPSTVQAAAPDAQP